MIDVFYFERKCYSGIYVFVTEVIFCMFKTNPHFGVNVVESNHMDP